MRSSDYRPRPLALLVALFALLASLVPGALPATVAAAPRTAPLAGQSQQVAPGQTPRGLSASDWAAIQAQVAPPAATQPAYFKASNTGTNDWFGWSIAVAGDTVVVGAPYEASNATGVNGDQNDNSAAAAGAAYVFVRDDTSWQQQAYLKASNTERGDFFGISVAITGDTIVVGAPNEDSDATGVNSDQNNSNANGAGAAYVFVRDGTIWTQQAYLKASNTGAFDGFGSSVAVAGDTVVVTTRAESSNATGVNGDQNNNSAAAAGAAYVFVRDGTIWTQQAYLKASNTDAFDGFGSSVAIAGNTIVVGALGEDSNATGVNGDQNNNDASHAGAAYVFVRDGTSWTQQAYLKASNTDAVDGFGSSVDIAGDTIVVGAYGEDSNATGVNGDQNNNSASFAGAAYVFVRSNTSWQQQAYLKASNTEVSDGFGQSVAIVGNKVVVGAYGEDSDATGVDGDQNNNSADGAGAAYLFVRDGATWSQHAYLKASNTQKNDNFGSSVDIADDTILVGAYAEDSNATGVNGNGSNNSASQSGAVYVPSVASSTVAPGFVDGTLPVANYGTPYSATVVTGTLPITISLDRGSLPPGLSFNSATGTISGTPSGAGNFTATLRASNGTLPDATRTLTFSIGRAPLVVTATNQSMVQGASLPALTYQAGGLRNGDTQASVLNGTLATTATTSSLPGSYAITQGTLQATANYTLTFVPGTLTITARPTVAPSFPSASPLPIGSYGTPYSATVAVTGTLPMTVSLQSGSLPPGLSLNPATGTISGTPTGAGSFTATLRASNGTLPNATRIVTFTIARATLVVTADNQAKLQGTVNPPLSYQTSGLRLNDTQASVLTGTLATTATTTSPSGSYAITQGTLQANANYSLSFVPGTLLVTSEPITAPSIGATNPSAAQYGVPYGFTVAVTGTGPLTVSLDNGTLPPGLSLDGSTGQIRGTPTGAGNFTVTLRVSNGRTPDATRSFTFSIARATLTVTATNQSSIVGSTLPTLTYQVDGLRLSDTPAAVLTGTLATSATTTSSPGSYAITQGTLQANANYSLNFVPGTLTIRAAAQAPQQVYLPIISGEVPQVRATRPTSR